jgi:hypothetical protein
MSSNRIRKRENSAQRALTLGILAAGCYPFAMHRIAIVSDIHYAGPGEQAHGPDFEFARSRPSLGRSLVRLHRHHLWMRNPTAHNNMLDVFMQRAADADLVVANGDYTCDVAGVGVSHDEACESVRLCLGKLRARFGEHFHAIPGDHELGKMTLLGDHGGLRLRSWQRAIGECGLQPFWRIEVGKFVLLGITSTLVALPLFRPDALASEWPAWEELRDAHLDQIRDAFKALTPDQRVLLFCHDPTALPFLWREDTVRARIGQIDRTIIGHFHTRLVLWKSRLLSGIPIVSSMGTSVHRMTSALNEARHWRPFKPLLCPSLAGVELFKTGGFLTLTLDETGAEHPAVQLHKIPRLPGNQ